MLSERCPTCRAEPGVECNYKRPGGRFRTTRQDLGIAHKNRDMGNAPWMEERVPGTN